MDEVIEKCAKVKDFNYFTFQNMKKMKEDDAVKAEKNLKEGWNRPLEGIPICIKDNIDTTDSPTTGGSPALLQNLSKIDSQIWFRLQALGCINVGKTNMNEFALGTSTFNIHYGTAKNPYDSSRITGGSSGGTGGAVGSGAVPFGLGTDHSGSIRVPSSFNGIVGYKPTFNRWPSDYGIKASHMKDTCGPMALDMADILLFDELVTDTKHRHTIDNLKLVKIGVPRSHF